MLFLLGLSALQKRKSIKLAIWAMVAFSGYCLLYSFSREAYAGILIGLLFLGLVRQRWILIGLAAFLLSWQSLVPTSVQERVLMTYDKNEQQLDTSAQDRVALWNDAVDLFQQNPVLGAGFVILFPYAIDCGALSSRWTCYPAQSVPAAGGLPARRALPLPAAGVSGLRLRSRL